MDNLKLLHKELVLVAVLLLFELMLIGTLQYLVNRVEAVSARVEKSESLVVLAGQLHKELWESSSAGMLFGYTRNYEYQRRSKSLQVDLGEKIARLEKESLEFPEDKESIERIHRSYIASNDLLIKIDDALSRRGEPGTLVRVMAMGVGDWSPLMKATFAELTDLAERHKKKTLIQMAELNQLKTLLRFLLVFGWVMQVAIALALAIHFNKTITNRLMVLKENALRFAGGKLLHPRLKGGDEIVELDSVFHDMARALTEAAGKERAIVNGMPVGFITLSSDGIIESINPRTQEMLKASTEQLVRRALADLILPSAGTVVTFENIRKSSLGHVSEYQIHSLDGGSFPAELSINAINIANREQLICNILDVSERHEVERMKEEFVSIVSHDLRTPLTAIQGSLHMLAGGLYGDLNAPGKKLVSATQLETQRLMRLVTDLLDIARMESGRIGLERAETALSSMIERSVNAVSAIARERKVELQFEPANLQVVADPERLVQVLVNLLSNAVKFSPANSTISITASQVGTTVEIRVTDQGPGIPQSVQSKIFAHFEQVSTSDRTEKGGTGLGLAICKLIIEAHGGTIGVDSEIGKGSSFWLRIPKAQEGDQTMTKEVRQSAT